MRIFFDTNVLTSSIATRGLCSELLEIVVHDHELLTCRAVLQELARVLGEKLRLPKPVIDGFLALLRSEGEIVQSQKTLSIKVKDADDIPILACAIAGKADFFVTGDKALLELKTIDGTPIISPRELWLRLAGIE